MPTAKKTFFANYPLGSQVSPDTVGISNVTTSEPDENSTASPAVLMCAEEFYFDGESGLCLPECDKFTIYPGNVGIAAAVFTRGMAVIGVIAGLVILVLSCANYKQV